LRRSLTVCSLIQYPTNVDGAVPLFFASYTLSRYLYYY